MKKLKIFSSSKVVTAVAYFLAPAPMRLVFCSLILGSGILKSADLTETQAKLVGATRGQFEVSPSGAATYSIPIAVPPGSADMTPELAFEYQSQSASDLLGVGWSIGGLSAIHRCLTEAIGGDFTGEGDSDGENAFCLDGERLVAVPGNESARIQEYRREIDSFQRIMAHGKQGRGPRSFKIWTKSGEIMEYGASEDSRIKGEESDDVTIWALNKVSDRAGNYFTVNYKGGNSEGKCYPSRIDYTANDAAGLSPYASIQFEYEPRPGLRHRWERAERLKQVETFVEEALVKSYRVGYEMSRLNHQSLVVEIQECASSGLCLPSLDFEWQPTAGAAPLRAWEYTNPHAIREQGSGFDGNDEGAASAELIGPGALQLITISDSLDNRIEISYQPLTHESVYPQSAYAASLQLDLPIPLTVVSHVEKSVDIGGVVAWSYDYEGLKIHRYDPVTLSFAATTVTDEQTGIQTTTEYYQDFPFRGMPQRSSQTLSDGTLIYRIENNMDSDVTVGSGSVPVFPYVRQSVETVNLLGDTLAHAAATTTVTRRVYDHYGNPLEVVVEVMGDDNSYTTETLNTYADDTDHGFLGQLTRRTITRTINGQPDGNSVQISEFQYHPITGLLVQKTINPGANAPGELTTRYTLDAWGNRVGVSTREADGVARITSTIYDERGQFPVQVMDPLGHTETRTYDPRSGGVTSLTDPNELTTTWTYDGLGRQVRELRPNGVEITWDYAWYDSKTDSSCPQCPLYAKYSITMSNPAAPSMTVYYDSLEREVRQESVGFDGQRIFIDREYEASGRMAYVSEPYYEGETSYWTGYTYDLLGRLVAKSSADGSPPQTWSFQGFTTASRDVQSRSQSETKNALGQTVEAIGALGNKRMITYDSQANATVIIDSEGNPTRFQYDRYGQITAMDDPDLGTWEYTYNAYGEGISQKDAKGQAFTSQYDLLGRLIEREGPEGISTWEYYDGGLSTPLGSIGKLQSMTAPNGASRDYFYDSLGRLIQTIDNIDGKRFVTRQTYDPLGRLDTVTYPQVEGENFTIQRLYNAYGYLKRIQSANDNPTIYWEAEKLNARGQVEGEFLGNGTYTIRTHNHTNGQTAGILTLNISTGELIQHGSYTFDAAGNLLTRTDESQGLLESFTYDALDRLTSSTIIGGTTLMIPKTYQYDALSNLIYKSDIGVYRYGENGAGPHTLTSIAPADQSSTLRDPVLPASDLEAVISQIETLEATVSETPGSSQENILGMLKDLLSEATDHPSSSTITYTYDANGNRIEGGPTILYTSFNKPQQITRGRTTVSFTYGADHNPVLKVAGSKRTAIIRLGASGETLYEEEIETNTGATHYRHFIYALEPHPVAVHHKEDTYNIITSRTEYFHRDPLGTNEIITDDNGSVVASKSYDAWGKRRHSDWTEDPDGNFNSSHGHLYSTGLESITEVGLIQRNGRLYDPTLGRFLSPKTASP